MYSQELINRLIKYYATTHGITISDEEAEIYLNSLADLFDSFRKILSEKGGLKDIKNSGTISA